MRKITTWINEDGFEFAFEPIEDTLKIRKHRGGFKATYLVQDELSTFDSFIDDSSLCMVNYHRDFRIDQDMITEDDARAFYRGGAIPQQKDYWIFPMASYIHSGVRLYLGTASNPSGVGMGEWDTSHVGLVLVSKAEWKTRKKAEAAAEGLINESNLILEGQVYGIVAEYYDKNKKPIGAPDSCWGYVGFEDTKREAGL